MSSIRGGMCFHESGRLVDSIGRGPILRVDVDGEAIMWASAMPSALDKCVGLRMICRDLVVRNGHVVSGLGIGLGSTLLKGR